MLFLKNIPLKVSFFPKISPNNAFSKTTPLKNAAAHPMTYRKFTLSLVENGRLAFCYYIIRSRTRFEQRSTWCGEPRTSSQEDDGGEALVDAKYEKELVERGHEAVYFFGNELEDVA